MRQLVSLARGQYERLRSPIHEFAKFAVIGASGVFITNGVYDLLFVHVGLGPVTSTTLATIVATIASYLGNRYWSFRDRQRTGALREIAVFAVLNGAALLIQDAAVAFNSYLLGLAHDKLAGFAALNIGIVLATLFRFWSYRQFVWVAPHKIGPGRGSAAEGRRSRHRPGRDGASARLVRTVPAGAQAGGGHCAPSEPSVEATVPGYADSGSISMAPHGHSTAHRPQPLQ